MASEVKPQGMKQNDKASRRDRSRSPMDRNGDGNTKIKGRPDKFGRLPSKKQVCVANIPFTMTWQQVKDLFRDKVGEVTYVKLFEDEDGRSKGMGIIEFANPNSVAKALEEMHRHEINGRRLVVKEDYEVERDRHGKPVPGRPRDHMDDRMPPPGMGGMRRGLSPDRFLGGPPPPELEGRWGDDRDFGRRDPGFDTYGLTEEFLENLNIKGPLINRIFISNIDYNVSEKKLREVFRLAGKIEEIDFMKDDDGKFRGRAVVEYDHPLEAVQAISMFNKQKLFERLLSVDMDKFERSDRARDSLPIGLKTIGRGLGDRGQPLNHRQLRHQSFSSSDIGGRGPVVMNNPSPDHRRQSTDNVPGVHPALSSLSQQQLLALISSGLLSAAGGANTGSMSSGLNLGSSNVPMQTSSGLGGSFAPPMGGLRGDSHKPMMSTGGVSGLGGIGPGLPLHSGSALNSGYDGPSSGYDSHHGPGFPDDGDRRRPANDSMMYSREPAMKYDTIAVRNLPHSYTWEALRDKFNDVGDVTFADIRNRGSGLVRFASQRDADRAVNLMNGTRIDGRAIDVQLYELNR